MNDVPAGWRLVPIQPTPEMIASAWAAINPHKRALGIARLGPGPGTTDVYAAMLAASPPPSSECMTNRAALRGLLERAL